MAKLFLAMFSIFSLSAVGAVPELPFPTGSCSGLIPLGAMPGLPVDAPRRHQMISGLLVSV